MNPAIIRTVAKNVPLKENVLLTEDGLSNALGEAQEVRGLSEARTAHQHPIFGTDPGIIAGEGLGSSNHDGNELQRHYDDPASLP